MKTKMSGARLWPMAVALFLVWPGALGKARNRIDAPECVAVRTTTHATGYGYDHIVYVRNGCTIEVECEIATNRTRKPEFGLLVPPGIEKGVVTGTHSKGRHFNIWVECNRRATADRAGTERLVHGTSAASIWTS